MIIFLEGITYCGLRGELERKLGVLGGLGEDLRLLVSEKQIAHIQLDIFLASLLQLSGYL